MTHDDQRRRFRLRQQQRQIGIADVVVDRDRDREDGGGEAEQRYPKVLLFVASAAVEIHLQHTDEQREHGDRGRTDGGQ